MGQAALSVWPLYRRALSGLTNLGFISPGLYKRERRFAVPFVLCTAGLFILGGAFAYLVVFRFVLTFLLGIGLAARV